MPQMSYFLATEDSPVTVDLPIWTRPLPAAPTVVTRPDDCGHDVAMTYGEYFTAIRRFLERDHLSALIHAATEAAERSIGPEDIGPVRIYLEKHGQYYHPARLRVEADGVPLALVVNVATTADGRACLRKDFANIRRLNRHYSRRFLPKVFTCGTVRLSQWAHPVEMFLGQWLEGYHEFHLSGEPALDNDRLFLWHPQRGRQRLDEQVRREIYRQAAQILTAYYDLETFEQVFSWHHAAGDFVVKTDGRQVELRLITVRGYGPLFEGLSGDGQIILQALLIFLLNLTVKMRLDRLEGVGGIAWASDDVVASILDGFFDGLFFQAENNRSPSGFSDLFRNYLRNLTVEDLQDVFNDLYQRNFERTAESGVIRQQLDRHGASLSEAIDRLPCQRVSTPI